MSHGHDDEVHIVSYASHTLVWLGLLMLSGLTVAAAGINLGDLNLLVAMVIATIKGSLVVAYFMHVKYEKPGLQSIILIVIVFMFVVFCEAFVDFGTR
ncbi:cytochrome-c oxidase [bacterium]|jgi:cytochrome c oxidase subunit IV|nr:cytochrome-c oxidase [bacterium]